MGVSSAGLSPRFSGVSEVLVRPTGGADCRSGHADLSGEAAQRFSNKSKFLLTPPTLVLVQEAGEDPQVPLAGVFDFTSREKPVAVAVVVVEEVLVGGGVV